MGVDSRKARLVSLGFKKSTEGLTPAEEEEYQRLMQEDSQSSDGG